MSALLLSDLHLPAAPSPLRTAFIAFLEGPARQSQQVYLLGDVFEYWIGDDAGLRDYTVEVAALRALSDSGVRLFFMHGNRDFVVGRRFARATGARLLADPVIVDLCGTPTLLTHGDRYCTDDLAYQKWRRFSRNRLGLALFRLLPETWRQHIAGSARQRSADGKRNKTEAIMDVNASAVIAAFNKHDVSRMIHGHTHRPADHILQRSDGARLERIVLADWRPDRLEYIAADGSGLHRMALPIPAAA